MASASNPATARPVVLRISAAITAIAAAAAVALLPAWSASAHSAIVDSTPTEGETLTSLPDTFSVTANESLLDVTGEGAGFALQIVDADGLHYEQSCPVVDGEELSTAAALGATGDYELRYQFVSADGHAVSGIIPFEWTPADSVVATIGTEASLCGDAASTTEAENTSPSDAANSTQLPAGPNPALWISLIAVLAAVAVVIAVVVRSRRGRGV